MDHDIFLAWLNETDNLSPGQLAEARRVLSGSAPFQTVVNLLEAKVREDRICPHCASEGAIIRGQASGLSRFFCKACGKTFNALTGTPLARLRHKSRWAEFAASLRDGETVPALVSPRGHSKTPNAPRDTRRRRRNPADFTARIINAN